MTEKPSLVERLREQRERHLERPRIVRALYVAVGITVVLAGLAMLVLPGPAVLVIPVGLAILSLEFTWAERLLERSLEQAERAKRSAAQTSRTQRIVTGVAVALGAGAFIAWAIVGDIPLLPV
ncbi:MAG TPA: PGPGW domain-containing protein [Solirubrobacteraceae bacterium]